MGRTAIRFAYVVISWQFAELGVGETDIFDIGARVDCNHVAMLDSQVMTNDSVDSSAAIIELLIGKDDQDGVLSLLTSHQDGVATEELKGVHGRLGQGDDAVVIVDGIGNPRLCQYPCLVHLHLKRTYIN